MSAPFFLPFGTFFGSLSVETEDHVFSRHHHSGQEILISLCSFTAKRCLDMFHVELLLRCVKGVMHCSTPMTTNTEAVTLKRNGSGTEAGQKRAEAGRKQDGSGKREAGRKRDRTGWGCKRLWIGHGPDVFLYTKRNHARLIVDIGPSCWPKNTNRHGCCSHIRKQWKKQTTQKTKTIKNRYHTKNNEKKQCKKNTLES